MTLHTRLDRLESDLHATVQRLTADVAAALVPELTLAERRAFCRVVERVQTLWAAGVPCPVLPTNGDVAVDREGVRLPGGAVLATADEWTLYRRVADRVVELWAERDGPDLGFEVR